MHTHARCALLVAVSTVACGRTAPSVDTDGGVDGGIVDGTVEVPVDGRVDAMPDAYIEPPDLTPPAFLSVTPAQGSEAWLHAPIRYVLSEAIIANNLDVTATLDGQPVAATVALEGNEALVVSIDPSARGTGTLAIEVTGDIRDLADNVLPDPLPALSLTVPAWLRPAVDRGPALASPSIAVSRGGQIVAAWLVDDAGAAKVAISMHTGGAWASLGGLRGTSASAASIAIDAMGRPVVAYVEGGAVIVERWDGAAWSALPSPGSASVATIGSAPDGAIAIATIDGASANVLSLDGDAWEPAGTFAITGSVVGEPALAIGAGGKLAVGWIANAGGTQRVIAHRRAGTTWTAMAPIVVGAPPPTGIDRMSLAIRGSSLVVAYDKWSGSFSVHAATANGDTTSAWTRLGRILDVDAAGDAKAPAIAIDASGAPIVAWQETIEGTERGVIARYVSNTWRVVGGPTWLAGAAAPTRASLALHAEQAPVVAYSASSTAAIVAHNGPKVAQPGMASRPALTGCAFSPTAAPARLSQTGCFTIPSPGRPAPHAGLVPYDLISELWSDGTKKRRWIALPAGQGMTVSGTGAWAAPTGTFIVKEFAYGGRAVETRFLVFDGTAWSGFSYKWRQDGSDADLMSDGASTTTWGNYTHYYPSRTQCRSCHHTSHGPLLGIRTEQLARWYDYNGVIADQLSTLSTIGIAPTATGTPLPSPHDTTEPADRRARAYLHGNCAHCHNGGYVTVRDMRFTTPMSSARMCDVITPGNPATSRLHQQVTQRPGMPPLGTLQIDPLAGELTSAWISSMTSCP